MSYFEYIDAMKEMGTPVAVVAVSLLCLFLAVVIVKMLGGMRRGTFKQLFRTGTTLLAAVIAYGVAVILSNSIIGGTNMQSIEDFILFVDNNIPGAGDVIRQALSTFDPRVFEYLIILPAAIIVMPIIATLIFLLINFIFNVVRSILVKIFGFKASKSNQQRFGGAMLGGVEAIIWIIMVSLPITGIIGLANSACKDAIETDGENTELISAYEEYIKPFSNSPAFTFIDSLGSGAMADGIATITVNNERTNLRDELSSVVHIGIVEIPALEGADFAALTGENKLSLDRIIASLDRSPFISSVVAGVVQSSSGIMNSELIPFDREGEYSGIFFSFIEFLEGVTQKTLAKDLDTVKSVYYLMSDSGVIKKVEEGESDIMALLAQMQQSGDDTIVKMIAILQSNERATPIIKAMTEALLRSLSTDIELPGGNTITVSYDTVKAGIDKVLQLDKENFDNFIEYKDELVETLDGVLQENGIEIEEDIVDSIANYIDKNYSNLDVLTDEQFNDVLLHYYDAYLEYIGK